MQASGHIGDVTLVERDRLCELWSAGEEINQFKGSILA
jgi:hypothetical protein